MTLLKIKYKNNQSNEKKSKKNKIISKYWIKRFKKNSIENESKFYHSKVCIISGKKKSIAKNSNVNTHLIKCLISNGSISNLKKSV